MSDRFRGKEMEICPSSLSLRKTSCNVWATGNVIERVVSVELWRTC